MGVPTLACPCRVCASTDPHDNRLRPSILLTHDGKNAVIDTTPDFRQQALRAGVSRLDDIRPFNLRQKTSLPVYASEETLARLRQTFSYVFEPPPAYSTIPKVTLHPVNGPFETIGMRVIPIPARHGDIGVLGFRVGSAAYLTDFSVIPESSKTLLTGLDDFILDALRDDPHPMHQTVEQALAVIRELQPRRAWFTHIAHELPHAETNARLLAAGYPNVALAYDGLQFEVQL
jgi:phosphoribosyl 1,2-cyclic phosphate phosphodiesterase